jgi:hypothetical protein
VKAGYRKRSRPNGKLRHCGLRAKSAGSLAPCSSSCTISVSFEPRSRGSASAKVQITDNARSRAQTVSLSGKGH